MDDATKLTDLADRCARSVICAKSYAAVCSEMDGVLSDSERPDGQEVTLIETARRCLCPSSGHRWAQSCVWRIMAHEGSINIGSGVRGPIVLPVLVMNVEWARPSSFATDLWIVTDQAYRMHESIAFAIPLGFAHPPLPPLDLQPSSAPSPQQPVQTLSAQTSPTGPKSNSPPHALVSVPATLRPAP